MQFIFLVETNKKSQSDYLYIKSVITEKYTFAFGEHKFTPIYMEGKGNYNKFEKQIESWTAKYKEAGETKVFICIDIDNPMKSSYVLNPDIQKYAQKINAEYVWFNEDVEQVFWGHSVSDGEKTQLAHKYASKQMIKDLDISSLEHSTVISKKTSNLCLVLDNYLARKE